MKRTRPPANPESRPVAWRAVAAGAVITGGLNGVQAQEVLRFDGTVQVSEFSRGFPLPAFQMLESEAATDQGFSRGGGRPHTLTLDDGTEVRQSEDGITVSRYGRPPKHFERASLVRLADKTRVEFQNGEVSVSLRGRAPIIFDVPAQRATFAGRLTTRSDILAMAIDLLVGLILIVHFGICAERLERGRTELATTG